MDPNASNRSVIDTQSLKIHLRENYKKLKSRLEEAQEYLIAGIQSIEVLVKYGERLMKILSFKVHLIEGVIESIIHLFLA